MRKEQFSLLTSNNLEIDVESGYRGKFSTLGGGIFAYAHEIELETLGLRFQSNVYFAESCAVSRNLQDLAFKRVNKSSVHGRNLTNLENNGIVSKKNGKVCRLMREFLDYEQPQIKDLERLFRKEENYKKNLEKVLLLRLNQLQEVDETLLSFINQYFGQFLTQKFL